MALHFKPNEVVTDIEFHMHYKEYCLANTRQRHRGIWGDGGILYYKRFKFIHNVLTFRFIFKTSCSLEYRFFQMISRRQLKLLVSRCEWSVSRLQHKWFISLTIFSSESRCSNASFKIWVAEGIIWKTPYGKDRLAHHCGSEQLILIM